MENEDSSDEYGEMLCSELDVPIITSEALEPIVTLFLSAISYDQWMRLARGNITNSTFTQLFKMCSEILKIISSEVLEVVEPQVKDWKIIHATQDGHNLKNRNFYSVTVDDIKASIGNTFDHFFGEVTGIPQERSDESVILLELVAEEVKKRVNENLDGQSASGPLTLESIDSETPSDYDYDYDYDATEMAHLVATILCCLLHYDSESPDYQDTVSSMDVTSNLAVIHAEKFCLEEICSEHTTECLVPPEVKCFGKTEKKNLGDMSLEEFGPSSPKSARRFPQVSMASSDTASEEGGTSLPKEQRLEKSGKIQISFGHKLMTFFNRHTSKVTPACDLNTSVSHSSAEDATITRPVANMQGSHSEETANGISSELLNNSPPKNISFGHKLRTFFSSKMSKLTPGSGMNTSEAQGSLCRNTLCPDEITEVEEFCSEGSVTPTCENGSMQSSKQSAIMTVLSSTGKILMKPFTCCSDE